MLTDYRGVQVENGSTPPSSDQARLIAALDNARVLTQRIGPVFSGAADPSPFTDSADTANVGVQFAVNSVWENTATGCTWKCLDATPSAAVWVLVETTKVGAVITNDDDTMDLAALAGGVCLPTSGEFWVIDARITGASADGLVSAVFDRRVVMNAPAGVVGIVDELTVGTDFNDDKLVLTLGTGPAGLTATVEGVGETTAGATNPFVLEDIDGGVYNPYGMTPAVGDTNPYAFGYPVDAVNLYAPSLPVEVDPMEDVGTAVLAGLTAANTNAGMLYVSILPHAAPNADKFNAYFYKDAARTLEVAKGADFVLADLPATKAVSQSNASGISGTVVTKRVVQRINDVTYQFHKHLAAVSLAGIATANTAAGKLFASVIDDTGGNFHVALYKNSAGAGLVGHTGAYTAAQVAAAAPAGVVKAITADGGSGLSGNVTVASVDVTTALEIQYQRLFGTIALTGLSVHNTNAGVLYATLIGTAAPLHSHVIIYSDAAKTQEVARSDAFTSAATFPATLTMTESNYSGIGGTVTVNLMASSDALVMTYTRVIGALALTGVDLADTTLGILYGKITDAAGTLNVRLFSDAARTAEVSTSANFVAGDCPVTKNMVQANGSGISGTVLVNVGAAITTLRFHYAPRFETPSLVGLHGSNTDEGMLYLAVEETVVPGAFEAVFYSDAARTVEVARSTTFTRTVPALVTVSATGGSGVVGTVTVNVAEEDDTVEFQFYQYRWVGFFKARRMM